MTHSRLAGESKSPFLLLMAEAPGVPGGAAWRRELQAVRASGGVPIVVSPAAALAPGSRGSDGLTPFVECAKGSFVQTPHGSASLFL